MQPDVEALGTVEFRSIAVPSDYIFEGGLTLGLQSGFAGDLRFRRERPANLVRDIALSGGVTVPATGKNLLQVELVASSGAQGRFDILATPNQSQLLSYWVSDSGGVSNRDFSNIPFDGGAVAVGAVRIGEVPEPATWVMLLCGAGILGSAFYVCVSAVADAECSTARGHFASNHGRQVSR